MANLNDLGVICSLGNTKKRVLESLLNRADKEYLTSWGNVIGEERPFYCGVADVAENNFPDLSEFPDAFVSRNNQLAWLAYQQISESYQRLIKDIPANRIAVVIGTSTSGIREGEDARQHYVENGQWPSDYQYAVQEMNSPAAFIAQLSGAKGPVYSISTACSSSGKALASAKMLLDSDVVDVVICGGVDSLSRLPNNGFYSLESISSTFCNPLSQQRDGINIGEAAALFVMSRQVSDIKLCGVGESSDAHHISAPEPEGKGAEAAMRLALNSAGLEAEHIDYVNLHGTGTIQNDKMECDATYRVFGDRVPCSSTKRFTGHTLGAAGALEAGLIWLLLSQFNATKQVPLNKSDFPMDPQLAPILLSEGQKLDKLTYCLSNSFAFGGNNISLIMGKCE